MKGIIVGVGVMTLFLGNGWGNDWIDQMASGNRDKAEMVGGPSTVAGSDEGGRAAPARDGNIAIREEYDMAMDRNTIEGWDLFIRRHPDHPLAEKARLRVEELRRGERPARKTE